MKKVIHIGLPKCASTSLQIDFFAKHPEIYFLGAGCNNNALGFADSAVRDFVEIELRFSKKAFYKPEKYHRSFQEHFLSAEKNKKIKTVLLSSESFSFNYLGEIDTYTKAQRLSEMFGQDTVILMVVRNQKELLRALYKEHIRQGYAGDFKDFMDYTIYHRYKNWFYDFDFLKILETYSAFFKRENIMVLCYEELKSDSASFLRKIASALSVSEHIKNLAEINVGFSDNQLSIQRELNKRCRAGVSNNAFRPSHLNRFQDFFADTDEYNQAVLDHELKVAMNELAAKLNSKINLEKPNLEFTKNHIDFIELEYGVSNTRFMQETGVDLKKWDYILK